MAHQKTKLLYIAGAGRSGTTLLDILVGEQDGFFSAGELRWIWWGRIDGWQCGCGRRLRECDFWNEVLAGAYERPSAGEVDVPGFLRLQQRTVRLHYLPRILMQSADKNPKWSRLKEYADIANRLYTGIARTSGARVVVDSSKNSPEAALMRLLPDVDPYLIHLVRDPRGVANSMKRKVKMEPTAEKTFDQPRHSTVISALIWDRKNLAADLTNLRFPPDKKMLVHYEDVVAHPRATIERIARFVGEPSAGINFVDDKTVELSGNHTAWGNPSRFKTGQIQLRPDNEWLTRLKTGDRLISTGLTFPLLLRYGIPLRPGS